MVPEALERVREPLIPEGDHPAVAVGAEVLAGIKAETPGVSEAAGPLPPHRGAERLCTVFDDVEIVFPGDADELFDRRGMTEEMHGKDGLCPRGYLLFDPGRIDVEGLEVDIDKDGLRSGVDNRFGGREKGERGRDHLVAVADPECLKGQVEGIRPRDYAEGLGDPELLGCSPFEFPDLRTEDIVGALEYLAHHLKYLFPDLCKLSAQVDHRYHLSVHLDASIDFECYPEGIPSLRPGDFRPLPDRDAADKVMELALQRFGVFRFDGIDRTAGPGFAPDLQSRFVPRFAGPERGCERLGGRPAVVVPYLRLPVIQLQERFSLKYPEPPVRLLCETARRKDGNRAVAELDPCLYLVQLLRDQREPCGTDGPDP